MVFLVFIGDVGYFGHGVDEAGHFCVIFIADEVCVGGDVACHFGVMLPAEVVLFLKFPHGVIKCFECFIVCKITKPFVFDDGNCFVVDAF